MSKEDLERAEAEQKRIEDENRKSAIWRKRFNRCNDAIKPWLPPWFNVLAYESLEPHIGDPEHLLMAVATSLVLGYVFVAWVLGRICTLLPPVMYLLNIIYYPENRVVAMALMLMWLVVKISRYFASRNEDPWEEFRRPTAEVRTRIVHWEAFASLAILCGLTFMMTKFEYGRSFQSVWVLAVVIVCSTVIPGVGGNSAANIITLLFVTVLGIMTIPDIYATTLNAFVKVMEPPEIRVAARDSFISTLFKYRWPQSWPGLGMTQDNLWDVARRIFVYTPPLWAAMDSWMGPGTALDVATEVSSKKDEKITKASAGVYSEPMMFIMAMELIWAWAAGDMYGLMVVVVTILINKKIWAWRGVSEWAGRGKGVKMVAVRAGFDHVFGEGPSGFRMAILAASTIAAWTMVIASTGQLWLSVGYFVIGAYLRNERGLAIIISFIGMSLPLLAFSIFTLKPMTGTIRKAGVDAYTPAEVRLEPS